MNDIRISPKYGVNASVGQCFYCLEDFEVVLFGRLPNDEEAPRRTCVSKDPCEKCKDYMKQGIIFISVRDGEMDRENPYRTGGWVVVTEDYVRRAFNKEHVDNMLKHRVAFIEDGAWNKIGLPPLVNQEDQPSSQDGGSDITKGKPC